MRVVEIGVAQLGPITRSESRMVVVERLLALLHRAAERHCSIVVFPELALTTLDRCTEIRDHIFDFALHRQPQHYGVIAEIPGPGAHREGQ